MSKQVHKDHYDFVRYMLKERWASVWHQLDEVIRLEPESVLEIGPGPGVFKSVGALFGLKIETLDLDPDLCPDYVCSATELPFEDNSYDVVCAFQMLEHLPYEMALLAFKEMIRVAKKNIIISLPDSSRVWNYMLHIPTISSIKFYLKRPVFKLDVHVFDGEHYWEINKKGYELKKIVSDFQINCNLEKTYRVFENSYHRILIFNKNN